MTFLLDTDWIIDHFTDQSSARGLLNQFLLDGIAISILTFFELWEGVLCSSNRSAAQVQLQTFLRGLTILPVSRRVALRAATIPGDLRSRRHPIQHRAFDIVIAATALVNDLMLVSSNSRDYEDIVGLQLLNPRQGMSPRTIM